ncbi:MAG: hypothetical protein EOO01_21540 [Chitinophagaceae bacterium]|nr:MAG: hypothetical protein EOO01_21540 [Chitinophagaceae bacterium]
MIRITIIKKVLRGTLFILLILLTAQTSYAQSKQPLAADSFNLALLNADSVWIASHRSLAYMSREKGRTKLLYKSILRAETPDTTLFIQQKRIVAREQEELIGLFVETPDSIQSLPALCFDPHHAVFIFKNGQTRFIDICFGCKVIQTSPGLLLKSPKNFSTWMNLENWFAAKGLGAVPKE